MQIIIDVWFVQGMIKVIFDVWLKGWDECNGGNLMLCLDEVDIEFYVVDFYVKLCYIVFSQLMLILVNQLFIVIGFGKFFCNVQFDLVVNFGVVKVDSDGVGYYILWGLMEDVVLIFELLVYFLLYSECIKLIGGKDWVIMYCYVINLIVLIYVLENYSDFFICKLWEGSIECLVVFLDGVGILLWMVLGIDEIGQVIVEIM